MQALGSSLFPKFGRESMGEYESYCLVGDNLNNGTFGDFPIPNMYGVVHNQSSLNSVVIKKLNHNANERNRRKKINCLFSSLRSCLPGSDEPVSTTYCDIKKLSISKTVTRSVQYIQELQEQVMRLVQKKEDLLARVSGLRERHAVSAFFNR
ncbi:hypothetical protein Bca52824_022944 [Brassica carinata]|uniref:BHLH domain-containing protein n=1 Tax=Brassica carinata TaxID=52824 RepID=A0A8X7VHM6_BRACI|nr:hypothetical protein Bca52824_022944 [Brassica carinata]